MKTSVDSLNESQLSEVIELIRRLADGDLEARGVLSANGDELDQIIESINSLAQQLSARKNESEQKLNSILTSIIAISALNFDHRAEVSDSGDVFDAVAVGLNALGEELEASVVSREFFDKILVSMVDYAHRTG